MKFNKLLTQKINKLVKNIKFYNSEYKIFFLDLMLQEKKNIVLTVFYINFISGQKSLLRNREFQDILGNNKCEICNAITAKKFCGYHRNINETGEILLPNNPRWGKDNNNEFHIILPKKITNGRSLYIEVCIN